VILRHIGLEFGIPSTDFKYRFLQRFKRFGIETRRDRHVERHNCNCPAQSGAVDVGGAKARVLRPGGKNEEKG
jgi:hypothetical protein